MSGALILTARFEDRAQDFFQRTRDAWFPRELNIVPAHLTLFHKLPDVQYEPICAALREATALRAPLAASVADVRFFGRGGAFVVRCAELDALRSELRTLWLDWLSEQDRQSHRPHVTYQNKVTKARAEAAYEHVVADFAPFDTQIVGLDLWWYRRHWDAAGTFPFEAQAFG